MLTLIFAIYTLVILTFFTLLSFVALIVCYPFDKRRRVVHELSRALCFSWWYVPFTWRRKIEGLENVDTKKPYVIVINHNSMVDIISIYNLPLIFKWVSKKEVYRIPIVGRLLWMHGDIVINRASAKEAMQLVHSKGMEWLKKGATVSIFPEGTRSKDGEIHNFKAGAFILAKDAGVPILPVVVEGTNTMRKGLWMNWRNRVTIKVLPPVPTERVQEESIKDIMAEVRETMVNTLAELRANKK